MAEPGGSKSVDSSNRERDISIEAVNHFIQGKRHLLVQDYPSAVESLQKACELFVTKYGEKGNECGEVYLHYGKALLGLARKESGILGGPLEDHDDDDDDDDNNDDEDEDDEDEDEGEGDDDDDVSDEELQESTESLSGNKQTGNKKVNTDTRNNGQKKNDIQLCDKEAENMNGGESTLIKKGYGDGVIVSGLPSQPRDEEEELGDGKIPKSIDEAGPSGLQSDETDEEEISNLQLAWEVLELAKLIFKRQSENNHKMELRAADTLLKLGEVSMESENCKQAVEDILECLKIQKKYLQPDDRLLAETHFQLGLAYSFDNQFSDAISYFNGAIEVIDKRISCLQRDNPVGVRASSSLYEQDPKVLAQDEIKELQILRSDIIAKIEDTQDLKRNTLEAEMNALTQKLDMQDSSFSTSTLPGSSDTKAVTDIGHLLKRKSPSVNESSFSGSRPASDIGHLVKRKRKPDEAGESNAEEHSIKKLKEDAENIVGSTFNGEVQKKQLETASSVSKEDCIIPLVCDSTVTESQPNSDEKSTAVS